MKKVTLNQILDLDLCDRYSVKRVKELMSGRKYVTAIDVINTEMDFLTDNTWLVVREEFLTDEMLHKVGIYAAELAIPIFEKEYPGEDRLRKAIEAKKEWLKGKITSAELGEARDIWKLVEMARAEILATKNAAKWAGGEATKATKEGTWPEKWASRKVWERARTAEREAVKRELWISGVIACVSCATSESGRAAWAAVLEARGALQEVGVLPDVTSKKIIEYIRNLLEDV